MNPTVTTVEPLANFKPKVVFANGDARLFDVSPYLDKGIFTQLKDEQYFKKVRVAFGAIAWPNEQDFSHDTLYLLGKPL
jgi:hypothetical protein